MKNLYALTQNNIGDVIKENRKKSGFSQSQLAEGICSQPLISEIEKGTYMPNALVLFQLCTKLKIDINRTFFDRIPKKELLIKADKFCRQQNFSNLKTTLNKLEAVKTALSTEELQMFHFYKVALSFRTKQNYSSLMLHLQNTLNLSYVPEKKGLTLQERLLLAQLGFFACLQRNIHKSEEIFDIALSNIWNNTHYSEHHNEIFLLYLFTLSLSVPFHTFEQQAEKTIYYISTHESHYLLSSIYYLLWQKSVETANHISAKKAHEQFTALDELFHEPLLKLTA